MPSQSKYRSVVFVAKGALFAFVTVPARMLFLLLLFLFVIGSPAGEFIATARELTGDAPPDQVWVCGTNAEQFTEDRPESVFKKRPCLPVQVDAGRFADDVDREIIRGWLYLGVFSLLVYFLRFSSGLSGPLRSALARIKFTFSGSMKS